nr:ThiF family adenylyltransferase [uncultured Oscillibacter sp.]
MEEHERFRASLNAIRSHDDTDSLCDELELDFEVVGLPQHRLIPVRNIEPITIYISNAETLPVVIVRDDFPIVPHLNVHEDNVRKSLCYSDLGYQEIRHKLNGRFLLTCIENWFRKTSMNQLHRPDQPLEPFFPYVNNVIVWNGQLGKPYFDKYIVEDREFGKLMYQSSDGNYFAVFSLPVPPDFSNLIHNMPQTLLELLCSFKNYDTIITWLTDLLSIVRFPKIYNKYFRQERNSLLACKVLINIAIPKQRTDRAPIETFDLRSFVIDKSLKDILTDYGLSLNGSKLEPSKHTGGNGANIAITPFIVHLAQSKLKCRCANLVDEADGEKHFSLVGVGAIGSHILNNCLRSGYGKWTIIDHDYFWPHNIARHVLTSNDIGYSKVKSLEKVASHIQSDSDLVAIASDVFGKDNSVIVAFGQSDIILDASASIAVERHLALDVQSDARRISCFLNPQGTATIMLLESVDRSARLDLLEMQYYRELLKNEKYSDHMSLPETMVYSGTCRSISSRISQDNISLSAALCCKAIKLHTSNTNGEIIIWTHATDTVEKESFMADKWITHEQGGWKIELSLSLLGEMRTDREKALPNETGGVLIGAYDITRKRIYVVYQVRAPEDSISSPTSFIRGCANLPERLKYIHETTLDNLTYIGEWHSHPSVNTQRSTDDVKLHKAIVGYNRENCLPGCMMILGTDNFSIFIDE